MGMNLFGHIAEHYDERRWGFDPGSIPTYPPPLPQIPRLESLVDQGRSSPSSSGLTISVEQGFQKPQGYMGKVWRVGVRVGNV